jgi:predicted DNA-binding transcriptional regulator YafY
MRSFYQSPHHGRLMNSATHTNPSSDSSSQAAERYRNFRVQTEILRCLSAHRNWLSARDIARYLDDAGLKPYSTRNLQNVLSNLVEGDANIERALEGRTYRYRWAGERPNWLYGLDDRDILTLMLARRHLEHLLPYDVRRGLDDKLTASQELTKHRGRSHLLKSWPDKVATIALLPRMQAPCLSSDVLSHVSEALLNDRWLQIDYQNAAGRQLSYVRVMPLALVQQGERLFLVCRFEGYNDNRNLALHRIQKAEATPHPFDRPDFSLTDYIDRGGFGFGNGERILIRLVVAPHLASLLRETPLSADQHISKREDGRVNLSATVIRGEQIRWWVRMHGEAIEVVAPKNLPTEVNPTKPAKTPL